MERINVESGVTKASKSSVYGSVSKNDVDEERAGKEGFEEKVHREQLLTLEFCRRCIPVRARHVRIFIRLRVLLRERTVHGKWCKFSYN